MQAIEMMEDVSTLKGDLPMIICEEQIDISFLDSAVGEMISKSLSNTRVGEVREHFHHHLAKCTMAEFCEEDQSDSGL